MRIVFFGTAEFAAPALRSLHDAGHEICLVVSRPPRPAGRGKKLRLPPLAAHAASMRLDVWNPAGLGASEAHGKLASLNADVGVTAAFGALVPEAVLSIPHRGFINIHPSDLPRWRGAAPVQRTIMAGDKRTAVCIMQMDAGLDTGPVLLRRSLSIPESATAGDLERALAEIGAELLVETLAKIDVLKPRPQTKRGACYAEKIDKSEARIDWTRPAVEVDRLIRALSPKPGAWGELAGERIRLLESTLLPGEGVPGKIVDQSLTIACGDGVVRISKAQRPGKKPMAVSEMLHGFQIPAGAEMTVWQK